MLDRLEHTGDVDVLAGRGGANAGSGGGAALKLLLRAAQLTIEVAHQVAIDRWEEGRQGLDILAAHDD